MEERRNSGFIEKLSLCLVLGSGAAAFLILLDPVITLNFGPNIGIKIGGDGFSEQLKGAVISAIIISGFSGVIAYWLGASKSGDTAQGAVNNIAQQAAPNTAAAVAAQVLNGTGNGSQRPLTAEELSAASTVSPTKEK